MQWKCFSNIVEFNGLLRELKWFARGIHFKKMYSLVVNPIVYFIDTIDNRWKQNGGYRKRCLLAILNKHVVLKLNICWRRIVSLPSKLTRNNDKNKNLPDFIVMYNWHWICFGLMANENHEIQLHIFIMMAIFAN